jgi:2-methylcitrate dehydratase
MWQRERRTFMGHTSTHRGADTFVTHRLAAWASALRYEDLSPAAVASARRFLLDSVACALGGQGQDDVRAVVEHARALGGAARCSVLGSTLRTDPVRAAWLNALAIRAMDFNDIYWKADPVHPSDLIPAALTPCEWRGLGGRELLRGIVIAYEVEMRLAELATPGLREKGLHHATLSAIAAPVAAGAVLGLDVDSLQRAIGISAAPALCLGAVTAGALTHMKNAVDPLATRGGVEAALLAQRGLGGPAHVLDGKEGLAQVLGHLGIALDLERLVDALPARPEHAYRIVQCGMKSFPIEALLHAPLTALLALRREQPVPVDEVLSIEVEVIARAADILGDPAKYRPTTRETADHSLPYTLAVGLVDGEVTPAQLAPARIADPRLHAVMDRVRVLPSAEFEALFPASQPSRVTLRLRDGTAHSRRVDVPRGDPRDPMTDDELLHKLTSLARGRLDAAACAHLRDLVLDVEALPSLQPLFAACLGDGVAS